MQALKVGLTACKDGTAAESRRYCGEDPYYEHPESASRLARQLEQIEGADEAAVLAAKLAETMKRLQREEKEKRDAYWAGLPGRLESAIGLMLKGHFGTDDVPGAALAALGGTVLFGDLFSTLMCCAAVDLKSWATSVYAIGGGECGLLHAEALRCDVKYELPTGSTADVYNWPALRVVLDSVNDWPWSTYHAVSIRSAHLFFAPGSSEVGLAWVIDDESKWPAKLHLLKYTVACESDAWFADAPSAAGSYHLSDSYDGGDVTARKILGEAAGGLVIPISRPMPVVGDRVWTACPELNRPVVGTLVWRGSGGYCTVEYDGRPHPVKVPERSVHCLFPEDDEEDGFASNPLRSPPASPEYWGGGAPAAKKFKAN